MEPKTWQKRLYVAYVLLVAGYITFAYLPFWPKEFSDMFVGINPMFGGSLFPIGQEYLEITARITDIFLPIGSLMTLLMMIVIVGSRPLVEIIALLFVAMLPPSRRTWGKVFDSSTGKPLSFVPVRIYRYRGGTGELAQQTVTDAEGRYRIHFPAGEAGEYALEISLTSYKPYRRTFSKAQVVTMAGSIVEDIPLEAIAGEPMPLPAKLFYQIRPQLYTFLIWITLFYSIFSFSTGAVLTVNNPNLLNLVLLPVTGISVIWNIRIVRERLRGEQPSVVEAGTLKPIPGALVTIQGEGTQKSAAVTGSDGVAKFDIPAGSYLVRAAAEGYETASGGGEFVRGYIGQDGHLKTKIFLKAVEADGMEGKLMNPFG